MTVCNMSIEAGARAGMVAPDEKTFAYLKGRPKAPKGAAWDMAMKYWETLQVGRGRALRPRGEARRRASCRRSSPGAPRPEDVAIDRGRGARSRQGRRRGQARQDGPRARLHGAHARHQDRPTSRSTWCSSARAPTAASRTCARWRKRRQGQEGVEPARLRHDRAGLGPGEGSRRRPRGSTRSSSRPASTGARPAAPCASA